MNQILHIFRKDVRQFWREIALSVGLLAAFTWYEPGQWVSDPAPALWPLAPLLLFGWGFLIVRDIQAEVLVGDRQFWVTRPYERMNLLTAKILFVVVVFSLPLLMADAILLRRAGFAPGLYVGGLLWLQLFLTVLLVLPVVTLGTVTSNVGQAVLVVLGVCLYFIAQMILSDATVRSHWPHVVTSLPSSLLPTILIGTFVAVIALQYAWRKTTLARGLLLGLAMALLLIGIGTSPPPPPPWIPDAREYPFLAAGEKPPVQLAFDPKGPRSEPAYRREREVRVQIPLQASGQAKDAFVQTDGMMVTIDAGGGLRWSSAWQRGGGPFLFPGRAQSNVDFAVDRDFFERTKTLPVAVQFSFVISVSRQKDGRRVFITNKDFAAPRVGFCWTQSATTNTIGCRYPPRVPAYLMISTVAEETTCTVSDEERPRLVGTTLYGWTSLAATRLGVSSFPMLGQF